MVLIDKNMWKKNQNEEVETTKTTEPIDWKTATFNSLSRLYQFKIFSVRDGSRAKYYLGMSAPSIVYNEIGFQQGMRFQEAKTKEYVGIRMLKNDILQPETEFWLNRKTKERVAKKHVLEKK